MASGSFSSSSYNGLSLYIEWSSTANINDNNSSVTATVYVKSYGLRASALSDSYIIINGNKKNWTKTFNISDTSTIRTTEVTTYTVSVPHNTDGTKSITIKANMEFNGTYGGTYVSDITASKTVVLDTIPRSSSFSIPSSIDTGSSLAISITPSDSSFRHKIRFEIDGNTKYTSGFIAAGTTSYSYTIPHAWLPASTSQTMTVFLYTYTSFGSDYIARTSKNITVNVPSNIKPSVSELALTIVDGHENLCVQGKSKITLAVTAVAGSGANISSYTFKGAYINGSSSSYTGIGNVKTSSIIWSGGTQEYKVTVKDTRGRVSEEKITSLWVYYYSIPEITSISAQRCLQDGTIDQNGKYAKVTVTTSHAPIGATNTATVTLSTSKDNYASNTQIISSTETSNTYIGVYGNDDFELDASYDIKAIITDEYNATNTMTTSLKSAQRTINIAKFGNGVAIGGFSSVIDQETDPKFECYWPMSISSNLSFNNIDAEQQIEFTEGGSTNITTALYKGAGNSPTALGLWDKSDNNLVWAYTANRYFDINRITRIAEDLAAWKNVYVEGDISAKRGHFSASDDADGTQQNDVAIRAGNPEGTHIDMDGNELIAKSNPTSLGVLYLVGSAVNLYGQDVSVLITGKDATGGYVQSSPTRARSYSGAGNMYITSAGTFGYTASSSKRYKKDIEDISDKDLDPYKILNIPIKQYRYNEDNVPIDKQPNDLYVGLIAEDVEKEYPIAAEYNENGQVETWNIKVIVPAMLKIIQDQQKEIDTLKEELDKIKNNS